MFGLEDKVILVTGGNRGIGASIVDVLSGLGARVAYTYRSSASDAAAFGVQADVTDRDSMDRAIDTVEGELGPIYGVVANAGITKDALVPSMTHELWDDVIGTNLTGSYNTIRKVLPRMYERNGGAVVFITSIVGQKGNVGQANYAASKAGLVGMAKAIALEGARYGVRCNALAPGFIGTEMVTAIPERIQEKIIKQIPMRRFGTPEEIAWATAFLLSPTMAGFITGETLRVNGGQHT